MKDQDLDYLRKKCLIYNRFNIEQKIFPLEMQSMLLDVNHKIEDAYKRGDARPLKAMSADIDDHFRSMQPDTLAALNKLFKEHLGEGVAAMDKQRLKLIEKILKSKKINNDGEYELLMTRVDELCQEQGDENEIILINDLLLTYK